MVLCFIFVWCFLGEAKTSGGLDGVLERGFQALSSCGDLGDHSIMSCGDYSERANPPHFWGGGTFHPGLAKVFLGFFVWVDDCEEWFFCSLACWVFRFVLILLGCMWGVASLYFFSSNKIHITNKKISYFQTLTRA